MVPSTHKNPEDVAETFVLCERPGEVGSWERATEGNSALETQRTRPQSPSSLEGYQVNLLARPGVDDEGSGREGHEAEVLACGVADDIGRKASMEDRHLVVRCPARMKGPETPVVRAVVGVFDGHNGHEAADFAAKHFLEFMEQDDGGSLEEIMTGAFKRYFMTAAG